MNTHHLINDHVGSFKNKYLSEHVETFSFSLNRELFVHADSKCSENSRVWSKSQKNDLLSYFPKLVSLTKKASWVKYILKDLEKTTTLKLLSLAFRELNSSYFGRCSNTFRSLHSGRFLSKIGLFNRIPVYTYITARRPSFFSRVILYFQTTEC